ncbi:MAG: hypothetical protein Q9217_005002 [Psora testacea]
MNKLPTLQPSLLEALIHHVALPARLPGNQDNRIDQIERALTDRLLDATRTLRDLTNGPLCHQWEPIVNLLQTCKDVNAGGRLNKSSLVTKFRTLERKDYLILHIAEQNTGLLVRRHNEGRRETVIFEAFEASPLSERVLAAENALQWDFPGCTVAIPYSEFAKSSFQDSLAAFLEQASTESLKRFAAHTNKAGSSAFESRDTVDPSLITQMLMTLLEVNGCPIFPPLLRKRVRDDVRWTDGAENPWRRCAYWLVIRVGLERYLYMLYGGEAGRLYYKLLLCLVYRSLLEDAVDDVGPELLTFLQAKLARRLMKLQADKGRALPEVCTVYESIFATLGPLFHKTLTKTNDYVRLGWDRFKNTIQRPVRLLRRHADGVHLNLKLPNSSNYLQQVLSWAQYINHGAPSPASYRLPMKFDNSVATANRFSAFASRYFSLSEFEIAFEKSRPAVPTITTDHEGLCKNLASDINKYLTAVADAYDYNPEQKSIMLLTVMELWMLMDQCAIKLFGLLTDYSPGFLPKVLDVLQLTSFTDMARLQVIHEYLRRRDVQCNFSCSTIFDNPTKGCFAERYYDESKDSLRLQDLRRSIETAAELKRQRKEAEWEKLSTEFEELQKTIAVSTCLYRTEDDCVIHDDRLCRKCYLQRKSKRMRINTHEHPLPSDAVEAKAVLFELSCSEAFAAYRNASWRIIGTLGRPAQMGGSEPRLLLGDYTELKSFMKSTMTRSICLASTKKSFLSTHYSHVNFPVSLDKVYLPNALKLGYFDALTKVWTGGEAHKQTFTHHCPLNIPADSPFSSLLFSTDYAADSDGPSSYKVIANQNKCPSGVNINEFMAYQALFSGKHRRWPSILIELGSSNLNFSTEATSLLISQLALQAGPTFKLDPLRAAHRFFHDDQFCRALLEQIRLRLDGISSNWRETNCMEMLLTLVLRLYFIGSRSVAGEAFALLQKARTAIVEWIRQLRGDIHKSTSVDASRRCSKYAFWAALLCRRTFAIYVEDNDAIHLGVLHSTALTSFIECSITLQDNLTGDPGALPLLLRNALIRDLKMVYRLRFILRKSLEQSPSSLIAAINNFWKQPEGDVSRSLSVPAFLDPPHEWWVESTVHTSYSTRPQSIHYHLYEGHLLVGNQPVGKLPAEHRESMVLEQLFGKQSLLTYPSSLRGMSYKLAFDMNGHQIHIGFRNNVLIIQACFRNTILELIPREAFGDSSNFDLPASLIENCDHWLDLRTGIMEIRRQQPDRWISRPGNWVLNFNTRRAQRRTSLLVDPHSSAFQRIASVFDRFEYRWRLTVFQPEKKPLSVEMRRLELSFFVNPRGLLECRQLRSEVDPNQDAGTWYGLNSKLVLRDTINPRQRSIIVPMGSAKYTRNGYHVAVEVENHGNYCRYMINNVLGRLDCPAEPRLLYLKAHYHACTSFIIPDPLTGRTGTEEALHCLRSGYCQPWTPLNQRPLESLMSIAKLTPLRRYYPKGMKTMQQVFWDPQLTTTIQSDELRPTIEEILQKSRLLSTFALKTAEHSPLDLAETSSHLLHRSCLRLRLHQRPNLELSEQQGAQDLHYGSRGYNQGNQARYNVFESAFLIHHFPSELHTTPNLAAILQNWSTIGGYDRDFDRFLLSDLLDLQLAHEWGSLVNLCRSSGPKDKYRLMFLFALISFRNDVDMEIVRALIAFMILDDLKSLEPPKWPHYMHFLQNHAPSVDYLIQLMRQCCVPYTGDERSMSCLNLSSKMRRKLEAAELAHEQQTESNCRDLAQLLLEQWPCPEPTVKGFSRPLIDIDQALDIIRPEWLRLFQNLELSRHIAQVQHVLDSHYTVSKIEPPTISVNDQELFPVGCHGNSLLTISRDLLCKKGPVMCTDLHPIDLNHDARRVTDKNKDNAVSQLQKGNVQNDLQRPVMGKRIVALVSREIEDLERIVDTIVGAQSTVHQQYGRDLRQSLDALKVLQNAPKDQEPSPPSVLSNKILKANQVVNEIFHRLCVAFERNDSRVEWLQAGRLWPCINSVTILEYLRSTSATAFGEGMKNGLVAYALSITHLQRLLRIEDAQLKGNKQTLYDEVKNTGHRNWNPLEYPDWLLLEIDANILIRHDQVEVAFATISPVSKANSVLQMNMGKVLADTKKLQRVIVPQPLLLQTAQLLQARLGGLLGREVRHVPFSRKTPTNSDTIKAFYDIHKSIKASSGVIIALPEHILSFRLSGLQRLSDQRIVEATQMVKVQAWVTKHSRDVLDECDFTLAVQTQLIYPSGSQTTIDGHPHRWEAAEALLRSVEGHLWNLQQDFPHSIEVIRRFQGGFPVIFFLRKDVEDVLIARLVNEIVRGQTSIIPTRECRHSDRLAIKQFISEAVVRPAVIERIDGLFVEKPAAKQNIYLVRGLLVYRILLLTLKKRWNVQYGLHPTRDPIAVPFHAKGVPSEQAEWGHPDVAILFTCLAFYFGGLSLAQLRQSLEHLVKSDDPSSEYDRWTQSTNSLPGSLREWNVINVDDEVQLMEIWQHVRHVVVVIDYFLNHFVFPKHAKQFRLKLQASGWDIPLLSPDSQTLTGQERVGDCPRALTTGFSGTNDNRTMLPLTIKQEDLNGLSHTNAEVLTYLLQPRNRGYVLAADNCGRHLSEVSLLERLRSMNIRMLIDAGAQILEMDNLSLAKTWLEIDPKAPAAVYFGAENKPFVIYRQGYPVPLVASPFADNLSDCLVYLDEAHTRGTDLKMPAWTKGALTLGLGQTKDHTVQAAMRLRQLATSQSIVFFAPPEVHQSILDLRTKKFGDPIDSYDVICWLLEQTCSGIEQIQPLHFSHGTNFCLRTQAALDNPDFLVQSEQRDAYLKVLRENEQQTLEQLYKPRAKPKISTALETFAPAITAIMKELKVRRKGFQDTGNAVQGSALQEVEQEREVAFEVETVREVKKPVHHSPLSFLGLHKDIIAFVETGRLAAGSEAYEHIFVALRRTSLGSKHGINNNAITSRLFLSWEFTRTVSMPRGRRNDDFLRQVNWILWSDVTETALVIIPEEAELLIPRVLNTKEPMTHLLTYAAPVTRKMLHFNNLKYYAMPALPTGWEPPRWLIIQLGIFAGRLYFHFDEYSDLLAYLGFQDNDHQLLETIDDAAPSAKVSELDGPADDVADEAELDRGISRQAQSFTTKPLTFLQEWLALRRKGQDFSHTPMGHVCQGKPLKASHPFFKRFETDVGPKTSAPVRSDGYGRNESVKVDNVSPESDRGADGSSFGEEEFGDENGMFDESDLNSGEDLVGDETESDGDV